MHSIDEYLKRIKEDDDTLVKLDFSENDPKLTDAWRHAFFRNDRYTLERLELWHNKQLKYRGAINLSDALKSNRSVKIINLYSNEIGDYGLRALSNVLNNNSSIEELYLGRNDIGCNGLRYLAQALKSNVVLNFLSISDNPINNMGAKYIADALNSNSSLISFNMLRVSIDERFAALIDAAILANPNIVYSRYMWISEAVRNELASRRENLSKLVESYNNHSADIETLSQFQRQIVYMAEVENFSHEWIKIFKIYITSHNFMKHYAEMYSVSYNKDAMSNVISYLSTKDMHHLSLALDKRYISKENDISEQEEYKSKEEGKVSEQDGKYLVGYVLVFSGVSYATYKLASTYCDAYLNEPVKIISSIAISATILYHARKYQNSIELQSIDKTL